jgi:membrane protease YdiL (CAAX protease family)
MTDADAILLVALAVVAPAYSYFAGLRIKRQGLTNRPAAYARTMLSWWLIALVTLFLWWHLGRPFALLGFALPLGPPAVVGAILCAALVAYMNGQRRVLRRMTPERRVRLRSVYGQTVAVLPRTPAEFRWFVALSITAGICEELLYRGYVFAVGAPFVTLGGVLVAGALIFGLGHAYQGFSGVLKTALAGAAFGVVYVVTGSLLWPVVLHVLIDVQGGTIGFRLLRDEPAPGFASGSHMGRS